VQIADATRFTCHSMAQKISKMTDASSFHPHIWCSGWPFSKGCILVFILAFRVQVGVLAKMHPPFFTR
jgi:hypothetical protein